jgi:hypothetical protein
LQIADCKKAAQIIYRASGSEFLYPAFRAYRQALNLAGTGQAGEFRN